MRRRVRTEGSVKWRPNSSMIRTLKWAGLWAMLLLCVLDWATHANPYVLDAGKHLELGIGRSSIRILWTSYGDAIAWDVVHITPSSSIRENSFYLALPLHLGVLIILLPTAILWRRDRRRAKGQCHRCGYNLTGNTSGVCPECGTAI